jgi:hypothetical protein
LPKNKFKMATKIKIATKTKFACKNYKSSFSKKKSGLFKLPKYLSFIKKKSRWRFFWHTFLGALIFVKSFKMVKFLHIFEEQNHKKIKKLLRRMKSKMDAQ